MDRLRKIVWSVDAFEQTGPVRESSIALLKSLLRKTGATVHPVYVLSPAELNLNIEFTAPWVERYRPAAYSALEQLMRDIGLESVASPEVLVQKTTSRREAVRLLCDWAGRNQADGIVVGTHARRGLARFLLGSFAETLILYSPIPIIAVGPTAGARELRRLLFPTDLGRESRAIFDRFLPIAKQLEATLTIFHSVPNPIEPLIQSGSYLLGGAWVPVHTYLAKDVSERKLRLEEWIQASREAGVPAEYHLDEGGGGVSDAILAAAAKREIDMIAMAALSGPVAAALIGSVTRQVVRQAPCPIWILRQGQSVADREHR